MTLALIILAIAVAMLLITLHRSSKKKNTAMQEHRSVVESINKHLELMDEATDTAALKKHYDAVITFMARLPGTIRLNNMPLADARKLVTEEYEKDIKKLQSGLNASDVNTVRQMPSNTDKSTDDYVKDLGNGMVRVKNDYLNLFFKGGIMDDDFYMKYYDASEYVDVPKEKIEDMENRLDEYSRREKALYRCAELNNRGIELEKAGRIDDAIEVYGMNVFCDNPYSARHSFDRLMVLYRKRKDYLREKAVVEKAISVFPAEQKYKDRLEKVERLIITKGPK
jgi:tetratricopeptide (TPR) repeat protein